MFDLAIYAAAATVLSNTDLSPTCRSVPGAEQLLADDAKKFLIVGERHGTTEIPAFFGDLVCLAASSGPVIVGLEIETKYQLSLDLYLASDGSEADTDRLLQEEHWQWRDGRASEAMLHLVERLRQLRRAGHRISLLAFMRAGDSPEAREAGMAAAWKDAVATHPRARLLALVGAVHAEQEPLGAFIPAAYSMPRSQTVTLSWYPSSRRGVAADVPAQFRWPRYDRWYSVGRTMTQSRLARETYSRGGDSNAPSS